MIDCTLKINETYTENHVESAGLVLRNNNKISSKIFIKNDKVYFFEDLRNNRLRLFSIISEKSFFL